MNIWFTVLVESRPPYKPKKTFNVEQQFPSVITARNNWYYTLYSI